MVVAYCSFCPKMPQKASKRGLLAQKSGGLLEFQSSGGLIKSGLLFARIRYIHRYLGYNILNCQFHSTCTNSYFHKLLKRQNLGTVKSPYLGCKWQSI